MPSPLYTIRPVSDRTQFTGPPLTGDRNPFEASWRKTEQLLQRELEHLAARNVVLEIDVREQDIRVDGGLRTNARAATPAVRLAFDSTHGPLVYATDRFGWNYNDQPLADGWQQNVRAIALGLESLRRVDRYGITSRAEQYRGFKAIGGAVPMPGTVPTFTVPQALELLKLYAGLDDPAEVTGLSAAQIARRARARTHPDRTDGSREAYDDVDRAVQVLEAAGIAL